MKDETYDVILLDMNFAKGATGGEEGFAWLRRILAADPLAVVILITAYGDVGMAVRAIKEGATDFILKPWQNEKLLATLSAALSLRTSRVEAELAPPAAEPPQRRPRPALPATSWAGARP